MRDGTLIPALGLGTWLSEKDAVYRAVREAISIGYRHIDCAWIYGNEEEVGRAINESIAAGDVAREQLWVTTKLWNDMHAPSDVGPALETSLRLLGLDYVDLYLVHWPVALVKGVSRPSSAADYLSLEQQPLAGTWEAMLELRKGERARHVGVSNFSVSKVDAITQAVGEAPAVNQVELHPYNAQPDLVAGMKERGVVVTAYSPLGSGGRPPGMRRDDEVRLLEDETVAQMVESLGASPAQVVIAWALARDTSVIPKSTNPERIASNFAAADVVLSDAQRATLDRLDRADRYVTGAFWCPDGSPYTVESLWR